MVEIGKYFRKKGKEIYIAVGGGRGKLLQRKGRGKTW